jgi:hypothetical protein
VFTARFELKLWVYFRSVFLFLSVKMRTESKHSPYCGFTADVSFPLLTDVFMETSGEVF